MSFFCGQNFWAERTIIHGGREYFYRGHNANDIERKIKNLRKLNTGPINS
jgi:hypothetical protein